MEVQIPNLGYSFTIADSSTPQEIEEAIAAVRALLTGQRPAVQQPANAANQSIRTDYDGMLTVAEQHELFGTEPDPEPEREEHIPKVQRPFCGARRRDGGTCKAKAMDGIRPNGRPHQRCRMHGSGGPRTPEGKARAMANLKRRAQVLTAENDNPFDD